MTESVPTSTTRGRIAGIDFGTVRIGVAITDPDRTLASPLSNYARGDETADRKFFTRLVEEHDVKLFVVGLPVHLDGHESQKSFEVRQFGSWLAEATDVPVAYFDERFTSAQADAILAEGKLTKKKRKARRDMLAAQIMLTAYLEAGAAGRQDLSGLDD